MSETNEIQTLRRSLAMSLRKLPRGLLLPVGLVLVLYLPTMAFGFVNWDDPWYVINNPLITSWHPVNLYRIFTELAVKNYAPLTLLTFLVEHTLWGLWPGGYHLTNVLLHALNSALVYLLLRQVSGSRVTACIAAALFAVHPVQIESVAWIASRKGLLAGSFILAALICRLKPQPKDRDELRYVLFLLLALLSKAIAVVVPLVVFAYDVLVRKSRTSEAVARQLIPGFLCACLLLITMSAQTTVYGGVREHMELSKLQILAVDSVILWRYVGMLLWPGELCVLYDPPTTGIAGSVIAATAGWLVVVAVLYRLRKEYPLVVLAAVGFIALLLPVLNLFPITTLMNDRYLYLPSIPFFAVLAGTLRSFCGVGRGAEETAETVTANVTAGFRRFWRPALLFLVTLALVAGYSARTQAHLPVWRNDFTLWEHASRHAGHLTVVQIQRAQALKRDGRREEAVSLLESALQNRNTDEADRNRIIRKLADWSP